MSHMLCIACLLSPSESPAKVVLQPRGSVDAAGARYELCLPLTPPSLCRHAFRQQHDDTRSVIPTFCNLEVHSCFLFYSRFNLKLHGLRYLAMGMGNKNYKNYNRVVKVSQPPIRVIEASIDTLTAGHP